MSSKNGSLYTRIENNIATILFGHPKSNSLSSMLLERLAKEFDNLSNNIDVQIIILKSEGKNAFCGGAFFDELVAISNINEGKAFFTRIAKVINSMRSCSKLIIGRIQGKTVGGGLGLAAACDYAMATEHASIKLSELSLGIGPFVIEPAVKRKIGVNALSVLTIDATSWQNAYWAKEKGLYARVFDSIKDLDESVEILANKLSKYNPEALTEIKRVLWDQTDHWEKLLIERAEISGKLILSDETKKVLEKFKK